MRLFLPITKVDEERREVYGRAAQEVADKSNEIMDYESSRPNFEAWSDGIRESTGGKSLGNVRAMHGKTAAGKVTALAFDDTEKAVDIAVKVVDDDEWEKVKEGVYTGFSIGGAYARRWVDVAQPELTRYTANPSEISLVDNPAIPTATFSLIKMGGSVVAQPFLHKAEDSKMATEPKGEYGTHEEAGYADPGYQEDEKPRYPLKEDGKWSEERIRAAWSYIHMKKNRELYTEKELKRIEGKIIAAWKHEIDPEGPPEADKKHANADVAKRRKREDAHKAEKRAEEDKEVGDDAEKAEKVRKRREKEDKHTEKMRKAEDDELEEAEKTEKSAAARMLQKGMYDVAALAQILQALAQIQESAEWESKVEGDKSRIPAKLKASVKQLTAVLRGMVDEETAELIGDPETPNPDPQMMERAAESLLAKRGKRHSKEDEAKLRRIHELTRELLDLKDGADDDAEKFATGPLEKAIGGMTSALEKATARIAALESQPLPAKGALNTLGKSADVDGFQAAPVPLVKAADGKDHATASLIKAAHQSGGRPLVSG